MFSVNTLLPEVHSVNVCPGFREESVDLSSRTRGVHPALLWTSRGLEVSSSGALPAGIGVVPLLLVPKCIPHVPPPPPLLQTRPSLPLPLDQSSLPISCLSKPTRPLLAEKALSRGKQRGHRLLICNDSAQQRHASWQGSRGRRRGRRDGDGGRGPAHVSAAAAAWQKKIN